MSMQSLHRRFPKFIAFMLVMALICVYFTFHLVQGERSYFTLKQMQAHSEKLTADMARLESERAALELKVAKMRPDAIDPDLFEEQALYMFGARGADMVQIVDRTL